MNPTFLDSMSWEMAEVYGAITDQILINLARHFPYFDTSNLPASTFDYQAGMLAQMGQVTKETVAIIRNNLADADSALQNVLEQTIIDAVQKVEPGLVDAVRKGVFTPAGMLPVTVSPNQMRAFQLYYQQAADKLNLVNTVMLESTKSAYQQTVSGVVNSLSLAERMNATQIALDVAAGETLTGVSSWNAALTHAMDALKNRGITGFIDHAGRQWSAEAYVAMDIRTTVFNTARSAVWETNQNFGNDLYQVSYHDGARPLCYPWQGKVISANNNARTVQDLDGNEITVYAQSDTSYGEAAGLFGINCKHYPTPFIPGVSLVRSEPQTEEENTKTYEESQKQRGLERKIREEKRDLMMLKAQGAPDDVITAQRERVKQTSQDIDDFCNSTGRHRRRNREGVYTKREFPDADKYNVAEFETKQKNIIKNYYYFSGGEQKGYRFGELNPDASLIPKTANVASQATTIAQQPYTMNYGNAFNYYGNRKAQVAQYEGAKKTLENAPDVAKRAWSAGADKLSSPLVGTDTRDAYYSRYERRVHFKTYKIGFEESSYQRKNVVFFHEYGHNLDNIFGGYTLSGDSYISVQYNGGAFGKMIEQECAEALQAFHAQSGMTEALTDKAVGKAFAKWVKTTYNVYQRGDISDMFERYMIRNYGIQYPFGVGHGSNYHIDSRNTPIEAFAEMFSALATSNDSLPVIKQFFPKSYDIFLEMLRSVV